jgi:hypothetical protein
MNLASDVTDPQLASLLGQYNQLVESWQLLRTAPSAAVFKLLNFPVPAFDQQMVTPANTGVRVRESGLSELFAGENNRLTLDDGTGTGLLETETILALRARDLRLRFVRLVLNGGRMNPSLLEVPESLDASRGVLLSPGPSLAAALASDIVTGQPSPDAAQNSIPLSSLIERLAFLNETIPVSEADLLLDADLARTEKFFTGREEE